MISLLRNRCRRSKMKILNYKELIFIFSNILIQLGFTIDYIITMCKHRQNYKMIYKIFNCVKDKLNSYTQKTTKS